MRLVIKLVLVVFVLLSAFFIYKYLINSLLLSNTSKNSSETPDYSYFLTGSDYKGNFVYGGAMQLAVNELNENILHGELRLNLTDSDSETERLLTLFNQSLFTKEDLDAKSYYIKSGYGQKTVTAINKETRAKFPSKSFADLNLSLEPTDIIAYAYFLKQIEYTYAFSETRIMFLENVVKGFSADTDKQRKNIQIIKYKDDDNFIVKLDLKDNRDEIYLAKGYEMDNPTNALKDINGSKTITTMEEDDIFEAPEVHLEMTRSYDGFNGKGLLNNGFKGYKITQMKENIKFDMDNKGARVENEAVIAVIGSALSEEQNFKQLRLDKPYWIIMKRANSYNPYFILGVKNTQILTK